jgi:hypothetical protein
MPKGGRREGAKYMKPAVYDLEFVRGSNDPKVFRFKNGSDAAEFTDVRLSVIKNEKLLFRASIGNGIEISDAGTGEVTFTPTTQQSRLVPKGRLCRYEIELWNGDAEATWLMGSVTGIGGDNDDKGG